MERPVSLMIGMQTVQQLQDMVQQFLMKLNMCSVYRPAISLLSIYFREMKAYSHKNLYMNAHSSFI